MKLGVVIVLYKTPPSQLEKIKEKVLASGFKDVKFYVIDNTKENRGYAKGVNLEIKQGLKDGRDLFLILNPDIEIVSLKRKEVIEGLKRFDILGGSFEQNGKRYFGGKVDKRYLTGGLVTTPPKAKLSEMEFVSGSFFFVKKKVIEKIGLLDEDFFLYYEDVEYCQRARKNNLKVGINKEIFYLHQEASSDDPKKERYLSSSHKLFVKKYGGIKNLFFAYLVLPLKRLNKLNFLVNFTTYNLSSLISKAFSFILFIFLIRKLSPENYGLYSLIWAQFYLFSSILDFGTTTYGIVYLPQLLVKDKEKAKTIIKTLFSLRFLLAGLYLSVLFISTYFMYRDRLVLKGVMLLLPVAIANSISGSYLILTSVLNKVYISSMVSLIFNLVYTISLITVLFHFGSLWKVLVAISVLYALYSLVLFILNLKLAKEKFHLKNLFLIKKSFFPISLSIIKKSYIFVLIALFASFYNRVDLYLLSILKGEKDVGIYSAGYKFYDAFMFLVAGYNFSATPILSRLRFKKKELLKKVRTDLVLLLMLGFSISIFTFLFGDFFLSFFFERGYLSSLLVLKVVIFSLPFMLASSVFLNSLYALSKQMEVLFIFVFLLLVNVIANILLIPQYSYLGTAMTTVLCEVVSLALSFLFFWKEVRKR